MTTPAEMLEKIRQGNRERAKKFYEKHKAKILDYHKSNRQMLQKCKIDKENIEPELKNTSELIYDFEPENNPQPEIQDEPQLQPEEPQPETPPKKRGRKAKVVFNQEKIIEILNNHPFESKNSKLTYINNVKTIFKSMPDCDNIKKCLSNIKKVIHNIETLKKGNNEKFSDNTIKSLFGTILFLNDKMELEILTEKQKNEYVAKFQEYKVKSKDNTKENQTETDANKIPTFEEYIKKVVDNYGVESKEYLIASIYKELPIRDDLQLYIISNKTGDIDATRNYLLIPRNKKNLIIILNTYKTQNQYKKQELKISNTLAGLFNKYLEKYEIPEDKPIFNKLSPFVAKMNKILGYTGGISLFRKMTVSGELDKIDELPRQEQAGAKVKLSKKLLHSTTTQTSYRRPVNRVEKNNI